MALEIISHLIKATIARRKQARPALIPIAVFVIAEDMLSARVSAPIVCVDISRKPEIMPKAV